MENDINRFRAEIEAKYKTEMENQVNQYKAKLDLDNQTVLIRYKAEIESRFKIEIENQVNAYKARLDLDNQRAIANYKANLEYQVQSLLKRQEAVQNGMGSQLQFATIAQIFGALMSAAGDQESQDLGNKASRFGSALRADAMGVINGQSALSGMPGSSAATTTPARTANYTPDTPSGFQGGAKDRTNWENWFAGLSVGDYRSGAFYWTAHRNTTPRGSCVNARNESYGEFTRGCLEAKKFLDQIDQWRADADYKAGWNSYTPPTKSQPPQCSVIGIKPDDPDGGLVIRQSAARGAKPVGVIPYDGRGILNENCACDGEGNTKCHVRYNGVDGWVAGQFLFPG
jgi:hypothetical protein